VTVERVLVRWFMWSHHCRRSCAQTPCAALESAVWHGWNGPGPVRGKLSTGGVSQCHCQQ